MNSKELRIGNLFIEQHSEQIIKVIGITEKEITFDGKFPYKWQALPIKLTEEYLIKLGFEIRIEVESQKYYWFDGLEIVWDELDNCFTYKRSLLKFTDISNVHQLQNLYFALTYKELNLK